MTEVDDRALGHRLQIGVQPGLDYVPLTLRDLVLRLDGHRLWTNGPLVLELGEDRVNTLRLGIVVSDLEVDAAVVLQLAAHVRDAAGRDPVAEISASLDAPKVDYRLDPEERANQCPWTTALSDRAAVRCMDAAGHSGMHRWRQPRRGYWVQWE